MSNNSTLICQNCGNCCNSSSEGSILLFPTDIWRIAEYLKLKLKMFITRYCTEAVYSYQLVDSLMSKRDGFQDIPIYIVGFQEGICPFFRENSGTCSIYSARPDQCRRFPFLDNILSDKSQFDEIFKECELFRLRFADPQKYLSESQIKAIVKSEREMEYNYYKELVKNRMDLNKILHAGH